LVLALPKGMSEQSQKRRRLVEATIIAFALLISAYLTVVIAVEGVESAVRPIILAVLVGVSLARMWAWNSRH